MRYNNFPGRVQMVRNNQQLEISELDITSGFDGIRFKGISFHKEKALPPAYSLSDFACVMLKLEPRSATVPAMAVMINRQ